MDALFEMSELIARHAPRDGSFVTTLDRLSLIRSSRPTLPMPTVYGPSLCLVAQGRKEAVVAGRSFVYDPARYLVVGVEVPVVGHVVEASPQRPYLCMAVKFDPVALDEIVSRTVPVTPSKFSLGLELCDAGAPLLDAAVRLLRLLDDRDASAVLAPMIERELLFRLLTGPYGPTLRQIAVGQGRVAQVGRAIRWIKRHFAEPFSIDALAEEAGMSASSLHEHFKTVTVMSPLQYQKQLRLQEARRLMLAGGFDAATAAFRVGYESPSQFSREYRRLFGAPPARDVGRLRSSPDLVFAA
jgi:AraC-like DNA-binding protein